MSDVASELTYAGKVMDNPDRMGDDIAMGELFSALWSVKWMIFSVAMIVATVTALITLSIPNVYNSEALLAPADDSDAGVSQISGQLGSLASLAGVNFRKGGGDKVTIGLEVLKSRAFVSDFIARRQLLVSLIAAKKWNPTTGDLDLDPDVYDVKSKVWIGLSDSNGQGRPSDWKAYKAFVNNLEIVRSKETGLITIKYRHISPTIARQWVAWLVDDINEQMRNRDIDEAQRSVDYLKLQLDQTSIAEMKQVFYQLIEKQLQRIMLANVRDEYVFKMIDPPVVPEEKVSPKRALIVVVVTMAIVMIYVFFVLARYVFVGRK